MKTMLTCWLCMPQPQNIRSLQRGVPTSSNVKLASSARSGSVVNSPRELRKKKKEHASRDLTAGNGKSGHTKPYKTPKQQMFQLLVLGQYPTSGSQGQYQHQFNYGPNIGDKYHTWVAIWTMIDMLVAMRGGRSANHHWWLCLKMSCPQNSYEECENDDKIRSSNAFGNLEYHISRRTLQHV